MTIPFIYILFLWSCVIIYFCMYLANGDIVVTLLPVNTRWPWITPAQFRPELVPEELMAQGLTVHDKFKTLV